MHAPALVLAAFTTAASAAGQAAVLNNCDSDVYIWTVGDDGATERGAFKQGKSWTEDYGSGTREIKVSTDEDALANSSTQTSLVYGINNDESVSYDLYNVFGSPFNSLVVEVDDDECDDIQWEDGNPPGGIQYRYCSADASVTLVLCGEQTEE